MSKPTSGDFTKTAGWLDWYTGPAKPTFQLPAGAVDAPLRDLWARVQGLDEVELQAGPDARVLRLRRAHFLPRLP